MRTTRLLVLAAAATTASATGGGGCTSVPEGSGGAASSSSTANTTAANTTGSSTSGSSTASSSASSSSSSASTGPGCASTHSCVAGEPCDAHADCASALCASAICVDPIAWWSFEGDLGDNGPGQRTLQTQGAVPPTYDAGKVGSGARFSEAAGFLQVADDELSLGGAADFTILAWVKFDPSAFSDDTIAAKTKDNAGGAGDDGWQFLRHSDGMLAWCYATGVNGECLGSPDNALESATALADSTWYRVAVARRTMMYSLFVDGVNEKTVAATGSILPSAIEFHVGRANTDDTVSQMAGVVDELVVVRAGLTDAEIASWMGTPPASP